MRRFFRILFLLVGVAAARAHAQVTAECATAACQSTTQQLSSPFRQLWLDAAQIHQIKLRFVDALRQFTEAQSGTFGDEGPALIASLEAMRASLAQWDDAIRRFETVVRRTAPAAEPHVALGTVYLDRHRSADAIRELTEADKLDTARSDVHAALALAYGLAGRPVEQARALRNALALDRDSAPLAYMLAQRSIEMGRATDALQHLRDFTRAAARSETRRTSRPNPPFDRVELLRQAAGVAPIFAMQRYADGFANLERGDYPSALASLAQSLGGDPLIRNGAASERLIRGSALLRDGQISAAIDLLQALAEESPNQSEPQRVLGLAYWLGGDHNRSIERLRRAVRLEPDSERARLGLAFVLRAADRPGEAEQELRAAIATLPRSGAAQYLLGELLESQSLLPDAVRAFEASEALKPIVGRDHLHQKIGRLFVNQANFAGAIDSYRRRIAVNPNHGEPHRQLGEIYFLEGRDEAALSEFVAAAWLDPKEARAYAGAGQVHLRAQRYEEAIASLSRALALDRDQKEAQYALGTALTRSGKSEAGKRELERFERLQSDSQARGQREFELEAMRREASKSLVGGAPAGAVELYHEIAARDPQNARSHRDLGIALFRVGRVQEAIDRLVSAQRLEATAEGYRFLADAHRAAGNVQESRTQQGLYEAASVSERLAQLRGFRAH